MRSYRPSVIVQYFVKITAYPGRLLLQFPKCYKQSSKFNELKKPFILVSNHVTIMDFSLYWMKFFGMNIRFLVAEVMFNKGKIWNWLLYRIGCIKVDRNAFDFSFIEESVDCLDRGESIAIFPSSRIPVNGVPFPFKPSVAIIALHSDAQILPCYTDGKFGFLKRPKIMFGDPVTVQDLLGDDTGLNETEKITRITENLEKLVYSLGDEMYKRIEGKAKENV